MTRACGRGVAASITRARARRATTIRHQQTTREDIRRLHHLSAHTPPSTCVQTGTKVVIMERYTCKEDLTEVHQKSEPFISFKDHPVQKLVINKSGQSYFEANVGFACVPSKGY